MTRTTSTTEFCTPVGLAIEVIGRSGSIALMMGREVVWCMVFGDQQGSAASIGSAIREASRHVRLTRFGFAGESIPSLDFVAVADGPGSFTGLRIAVTAANSLAYAAGVPVIGVDSLAAIAAEVDSNQITQEPKESRILVGLNAYRGQVFACSFAGSARPLDYQIQAIGDQPGSQLLLAADWHTQLGLQDSCTRYAGDRSLFEHLLSDPTQNAAWQPSGCWASGVGRIAADIFEGRIDYPSPFTAVQPRYFRPSAAEEQLDFS